MERSHESWSNWHLAANDPLLHAMYSQKPQGAASRDGGQMRIQFSAYSETPSAPLPITPPDEDTPTRLDSTTLDAIEVIYEKLVQVKEKSRSNRRKMAEVTKKKDEKIEKLTSKCAMMEEELRCKAEELTSINAGLQKLMKITERVDIEFSDVSEQSSSELKKLKRRFKEYEASTGQHIFSLNTEIRVRDTGLLHAITVNQKLETELLNVRNELSQQHGFNNQLQAELQVNKLETKRLESEVEAAKKARLDTVSVQQYRDLKRDQEHHRGDQGRAHRKNLKVVQDELEKEKGKTQKQEKEIQEQKTILGEQHEIIEQQQADLELSIKALEARLSPDYKPPEAEIEDLNDKLLARESYIEELDGYIDSMEKQLVTNTKKVEERTSQTGMDREKAEERAREWRKVPLDKRLDEARKSIIAEDCFLKCLLVGKE